MLLAPHSPTHMPKQMEAVKWRKNVEIREEYSFTKLLLLTAFCLLLPIFTLFFIQAEDVTYFSFVFSPYIFPIFQFFMLVFSLIGLGVLAIFIKTCIGMPAIMVSEGYMKANLAKSRLVALTDLIDVFDGPGGIIEFEVRDQKPLKLPVMIYRDPHGARTRLKTLVSPS